MNKTLYDILQVSPHASQEVIKNAYRALAVTLHPDTNPEQDGEGFRRLKEAFETLSDPTRRNAYDQKMNSIGLEEYFRSKGEPEPSIRTVKRRDGTDTWCTIEEHINRQGTELACTDLTGVKIQNSDILKGNLSGALLDNALLENVSLRGASLEKAEGRRAIFKNVCLDGVNFNHTKFNGCTFENCSFSGAILPNCLFQNCIFQDIQFELRQMASCSFKGSYLKDSEFTGQQLYEDGIVPVLQATHIDFSKCNLESAKFIQKKVRDKTFTKRALQCGGLYFENCNFSGANLNYTDFRGLRLKDCTFGDASLVGANFTSSIIHNIDFRQCNVIDSRFHSATVYDDVLFPEGFAPPVIVKKTWMKKRKLW